MAVKTIIRRSFGVKKREEMTQEEKIQDEINNGDELIEKILNSKKIRYENLNDFFKSIPKGKDTITLYIDIYSVFSSIYNPNVLEEIKSFDERKRHMISSNIINMAGHFRRYFATRKGLYTNIVFFYSSDKAKQQLEIYPDYKSEFYNKRLIKYSNNSDLLELNKLMEENFKLCKIICDYLPHTYFIDSKQTDPLLVPYYYIKQQLPNEISVIYSNDKLQALNCLDTHKNTLLLRSSYTEAKLFNQLDLIDLYSSKKYDCNINPQLLPYLFLVSGYKKYNVNGFKNYGEIKTLKLFEKLIEQGIIKNSAYKSYISFLEDIKTSENISEEQFNIIERNLKLLNPQYMYNNLSESDEIKIFTTKDLQDINSLNQINDEYYDFYPLQLEDLLMGEDYESV